MKELGNEEMKSVNGGSILLGALGVGLAAIAFAYQLGKDVAKMHKANE